MLTRVHVERAWRHRGYDCVIKFHNGYRCGYVRVPYGHPWFCLRYDDVDPVAVDIRDQERDMDSIGAIPLFLGASAEGEAWLSRLEAQVEIHGGLTFSSCFDENSGWWFGFDCFHAGDKRSDAVENEWMLRLGRPTPNREGHYWTNNEVVAQVESLADQVFAASLRNAARWGGHEMEVPNEARMAWRKSVQDDERRARNLRENYEIAKEGMRDAGYAESFLGPNPWAES